MSAPHIRLSPSLRQRVSELLPPRAVGLAALSALAERLRVLQTADPGAPGEAHLLLLESGLAAQDSLVRVLQREVRGLSEPVAEEVVAERLARLGRTFDGWQGTGSFRAYLSRILVRDALDAAAREGGDRRCEQNPERLKETAEPPSDLTLTPTHLHALRRFAWYLYGSPDNPERVRSENALVDYLAYCARLERRPFAQLVRDLQPRPGSWDLGRGEADNKWWRGRAQVAHRHVSDALSKPKYRAMYMKILAELEGGGGAEEREGRGSALATHATLNE